MNHGTLKPMLTTQLSRPKRLSRPQTPPPFRLTDRDIALIQAVARWRFATSEQLVRYARISDPTASEQQISRRLLALFAHKYLDRPANQHVQLQSFSHLVYGTGRKGAQLLYELGEDVDPRLKWTQKNSRASNAWLLHALGVTETMILIEAACAERADVSLIDGGALLEAMPEATRARRDPFRLRVTVTDNFKKTPLSVIPDRLFSLAIGGDRRFNFALEFDRASMSVTGRFARKIAAYQAAYRQDRHREQWGFAGFRVLTITPSEKRIEHMLAAQHEITRGRLGGMFAYSTPSRLNAQGPFGPIWITNERQDLALLEGI